MEENEKKTGSVMLYFLRLRLYSTRGKLRINTKTSQNFKYGDMKFTGSAS